METTTQTTTQTPPPTETQPKKWDKPIIGRLYSKVSKKTGNKFLTGFVNTVDDFGKKNSVEICIYPNHYKKDRDDGKPDCDYFIYADDYRSNKAKEVRLVKSAALAETDGDNSSI